MWIMAHAVGSAAWVGSSESLSDVGLNVQSGLREGTRLMPRALLLVIGRPEKGRLVTVTKLNHPGKPGGASTLWGLRERALT